MFSSSARNARLALNALRRPVRASSQRAPYSSYQPPNAPKPSDAPSNAHRAFYGDFGAPVAKVFLGALATYQVLYWVWLKLESYEIKDEKNAELAELEAQVRELTASANASKGDGK